MKINHNTSSIDTDKEEIIDSKLNNVEYSKDKINIYFFWGDGCPHCVAEKEFFNNIEKEYGELYNLHMFEVWYNDKNAKILEQFANKLGKEVKEVPFTIIGNEVFEGFSDEYETKILKSILNQYQNSYDVYFDIEE